MNKTCLITGAASGLGYEFARLAAADHYELLLLDIQAGRLEEARIKLIGELNAKAEVLAIDLGKPEAYRFLDTFLEERRIDMLIINAGFGLYGRFAETDWNEEEKMIQLHVLTASCLLKKILKSMIAAKAGKVMLVSSLASYQPGPYFSVYSATKAYLRSLSIAVAAECKGTGVTVTAFCPGQTRTGFGKEVSLRSNYPESRVRFFVSQAEEVARIGYTGMNKGQQVVIPGFFNRIFAGLSHLLPATLAANINGKLQRKLRE